MVVDVRLVRLDTDAGAAVPDLSEKCKDKFSHLITYLRSLLAVPPEGEHVLTRAEVGRDLQPVHDGEEELGEAEDQVGLAEAQEAGGGGWELGPSPQAVSLQLSEVSAVRSATGGDGVLGPLAALWPGPLPRPVGQEPGLLSVLAVLDPLAVPVEV